MHAFSENYLCKGVISALGPHYNNIKHCIVNILAYGLSCACVVDVRMRSQFVRMRSTAYDTGKYVLVKLTTPCPLQN